MNPQGHPAPEDAGMPEAARRNRNIIIVATIVLAGLPLVLGALRLLGYI